jgi:hypothetical protein
MDPTDIDAILSRIQAHMHLDRETENDVLDEIRSHLEEAVAEARSEGAEVATSLAEIVERFGLEEVGAELQGVHAGWGTADAVIAAGFPVCAALALRWLIFAPDGTALGWPQMLARPAVWAIVAVALLLPLIKIGRWRYALAAWVFFWSLTVIFLLWPARLW